MGASNLGRGLQEDSSPFCRGWFHESSQKGSPKIGLWRHYAATWEQATFGGLCEAVQGPRGAIPDRPEPLRGQDLMSGGRTGICVSSQKGSRGRFERETGGKEGSRSNLASNIWSGRVPRVLVRVPKREVTKNWAVGAGGGHSAATSEQAVWRSGKVGGGQAESPLQDVGVRDVAGGGVRPQGAGHRHRAGCCVGTGTVGCEAATGWQTARRSCASSRPRHGNRWDTGQPATWGQAILGTGPPGEAMPLCGGLVPRI